MKYLVKSSKLPKRLEIYSSIEAIDEWANNRKNGIDDIPMEMWFSTDASRPANADLPIAIMDTKEDRVSLIFATELADYVFQKHGLRIGPYDE